MEGGAECEIVISQKKQTASISALQEFICNVATSQKKQTVIISGAFICDIVTIQKKQSGVIEAKEEFKISMTTRQRRQHGAPLGGNRIINGNKVSIGIAIAG